MWASEIFRQGSPFLIAIQYCGVCRGWGASRVRRWRGFPVTGFRVPATAYQGSQGSQGSGQGSRVPRVPRVPARVPARVPRVPGFPGFRVPQGSAGFRRQLTQSPNIRAFPPPPRLPRRQGEPSSSCRLCFPSLQPCQGRARARRLQWASPLDLTEFVRPSPEFLSPCPHRPASPPPRRRETVCQSRRERSRAG